MDIKSMFANIPSFLSALKKAKESGNGVYLVDDGYLTSLRALVQESVDSRKQWLGYFLLSTTLDMHSLATFPQAKPDQDATSNSPMALLGRHLNTYLAAISSTIGKHDLTSDMLCISLKAWSAIVTLLHGVYDQRHHASTLQAHKQVFQAVVRKVERYVRDRQSG